MDKINFFPIFTLYIMTLHIHLLVLVIDTQSRFYINNHVICEQRKFDFFLCLYGFLSSYLVAVATISRTMLNRNGEQEYPFFVINCSRKALIISSLSMMLALGLLLMPFIRLRKFPSSPSILSGFYTKLMWNFVKCFSGIYLNLVIFFFLFIMLTRGFYLLVLKP